MNDLAARFERFQSAESRIDIVRRFWQKNLDETYQQLDAFEQPTVAVDAKQDLVV